ncbi:MAG: N-acetylmuramoyl-L-alanine amidase [Pseudopedobacter saltans]|uniref:N-acetylmuramoyl-L-alanine amidase n=1 Tax=Pseudopedobacter saltans TaxID=151895 RepID=A0A2W5GJ09_9SPHI|nr:MAG: N-acetylmuramoyl-L-alanine amidase [Pseudopedobacter saltans]
MAIFLSAGHHLKDTGAIGISGRQENQETIKLRDAILNFIKPTYKVITDNDSETLAQYLNRIKPGNGSVVLELHFDAYNQKASGTTGLYKDGANNLSIQFANELTEKVSTLLNIPNRGGKSESQSNRGKLGLTRKDGITVLLELCFIDNGIDMQTYDIHFMDLAKLIANLLMKYDDLII